MQTNTLSEQFDHLFKTVDYKGLTTQQGQKKLRFVVTDVDMEFGAVDLRAGTYILEIDSSFKIMDRDVFSSHDQHPELLLNKFMWSEEKETADGIIFVAGKLVLIQRKYAPLGWAMPGGMVDPGEDSEQAFLREMNEELNLTFTDYKHFKTQSVVEPRGPVKTSVFVANTTDEPVAGDDALAYRLFDLDKLSKVDFAFAHHKSILQEYTESLKG